MPPPTLRGRSKPAFRFFSPHKTPILSPTMISVAEAIQIVRQQTHTLPVEQISLPHALGRVLAQDIVADSDLPPFDRSQMDGYAVRALDAQAHESHDHPAFTEGVVDTAWVRKFIRKACGSATSTTGSRSGSTTASSRTTCSRTSTSATTSR